MSFSIVADKEHKIIKYKLSGVLDESNMGTAWKEIIKMKEFYESGYNILSDYRDAVFKFSINETNFLDEFIFNIRRLLKGKKSAVIVNVPIYTAISVLIKEKFINVPDFDVKIFSTEEAAIDWLSK